MSEITEDIKLTINYTQDSDCMQNDNLGQNLTIRTESDGVADSYFIIETDRWAFDDIQEFIDILTKFKNKYDKLNDTKTD
jgi:hypothetical protein